MYGAGSSVAAGDVLVTIKAKYESVDAALKSLKGLDKAIVAVNKKKIKIEAGATNRAIVELTGNIDGATRALTGFKGKSTFINKFGGSIRDLNSQIASANKGLLEESKAANRAEAALMGMGVAFKKLRLEQNAYREGSKKLFKDTGKAGVISDKDYLPNFSKFKTQMQALAKAPAAANDLSSALEEVRYLLNYAVEDEEEWKDLLQLENKLLEKQVKFQEKAAKFTKEKATAARDSATAQGPSSVTRTGIPEFDRFNVAGMESTQATILEMSTRLAGQTGVPQNEIIKAFSTGGKALDDMSKRLMKLQGVTGKVSDELVKLANAATQAAQAQKGPKDSRFDSTGRKLSVGERFNRRFGANYGRGGIWGEGKLPNREFRGMRRGMRRGLGSKMGQSMLLGGGFPMLFGGGAGAVGGSLLGSGMAGMMGMPSAGFGLQIMGSAIGTMLEQTLTQSKKLADALAEMNMDNLLSQGIRLSAEMQFQVAMLEKQGRYKEARGLMESQVQKQTGASGSNMRDVAGAVNILGATWNDFRNSVGATLGIIASPFLVALAGILKVVGNIFTMWNGAFATIKSGIDLLGRFVPGPMKGAWKDFTDGLNKGLQEGLNKLSMVNAEMAKQNQIGKEIFDLEKQKYTVPSNTEQKVFNDDITRRVEIQNMEKRHASEMAEFNQKWKKELASMDEQEQEAWRKHLKERQEQEENTLMLTATRRRAALEKAFEMEEATGEHRKQMIDREIKLLREKDELAANKGMFRQDTTQLEKEWDLQKRIADKIGEIDLKKKELDVTDKKGHAHVEVLEKELELLREKLNLVEQTSDAVLRQRQLWRQVGDTINNSIVSALENAITKAQSFGEILSSLLMSVGRMFLSAGVNAMMGDLFTPATQGQNPVVQDPSWIKTNAGGYFDSTTRAVVSEAGEGEYIIPESKMSDALANYSQGMRGDSILADTPAGEIGEQGGGSVSGGSIDVRFTTEQINNVSYVTTEQFRAGVQQAASEGAKRGQQSTLRLLQNSSSTRGRLGLK